VDGGRLQGGQFLFGSFDRVFSHCLSFDFIFGASKYLFIVRNSGSQRKYMDFLCHLLYFFPHVFSFISEKY
jgi:hypothetical protein